MNVGVDREPAEVETGAEEDPLAASTRGAGGAADRTVRMPDESERDGDAETEQGAAAPAAETREAEILAVAARATGLEVLEVLGRGGMGVVLKARDPKLDRVVAVKLPVGGALTDPAAAARFRTEAKAIASVQHPHVAAVYAVGGEDDSNGGGTPFLVMEYLPGGTLAGRARGEPQTPTDAARLMATLARAVAALHDRGVLHRDLKPANVMFAAAGTGLAGTPKIGDFGLAKRIELPDGTGDGGPSQTNTGEILGTPSYMAPEQAGGVYKLLGPPCDVYALGAILYEMLTGRPPFRGADVLQTVLQVLSDDPVPPRRLTPATPRDLETICLKCLAKSPRKRYPTAAALAEDLERFLKGEPIAARPVGRTEKAVRWARRHPARAGLIVVSAASLLALIGGGLWYNAQLREELDRSTRLVESGRGLARYLSREHLEELADLSGTTGPRENLSEELVAYLTRVAEVVEERPDFGDAPFALELAEAFGRVGTVQLGVGGGGRQNAAAALASYDRAERLYEIAEGAANRGGDEQALKDVRLQRFLLRQSRAEAENAAGRYDDALETLSEADGMIAGLEADGAMTPRGKLLTRATVWGHVASNQTAAGDLDAAAEALTTAAAFLDRAADTPAAAGADPLALPVARATLEERRGTLAVRRGRLDEARSAFERALPFVEAAATRAPDNDLYAANLAVTLQRLADLELAEGDPSTALDRLRRVEAIHRRRIERDPDNVKAEAELLTAYESLLFLTPGEEAVRTAREAVDLADRLAARDRQNVDAAFRRLTMRSTLGSTVMNLGRFDEAHAVYEAARALALERPETFGGTDRRARRFAAQSLLNMAQARALSSGSAPDDGTADPIAPLAAAERLVTRAVTEFTPLIETGPGRPTPSQDLLDQAASATQLRDYLRDAIARMREAAPETGPRSPLIAPKPADSPSPD